MNGVSVFDAKFLKISGAKDSHPEKKTRCIISLYLSKGNGKKILDQAVTGNN